MCIFKFCLHLNTPHSGHSTFLHSLLPFPTAGVEGDEYLEADETGEAFDDDTLVEKSKAAEDSVEEFKSTSDVECGEESEFTFVEKFESAEAKLSVKEFEATEATEVVEDAEDVECVGQGTDDT